MYKEKTLKMELFSEICFFDPRNHDWFHNRNPHVTPTYYAQHLRWAGIILKVSISNQKKKTIHIIKISSITELKTSVTFGVQEA